MLAKGLLYCNLFEIQLKIQDLRLYYSTADHLKYEIWKCKLYYGRLNPIAWIP